MRGYVRKQKAHALPSDHPEGVSGPKTAVSTKHQNLPDRTLRAKKQLVPKSSWCKKEAGGQVKNGKDLITESSETTLQKEQNLKKVPVGGQL